MKLKRRIEQYTSEYTLFIVVFYIWSFISSQSVRRMCDDLQFSNLDLGIRFRKYSASDFHILSTWLFGYCGVILKYVDNLSPRRQSESESGGIYRKCGEYQINPHQIQKHKMVRINRKKRNSVYSRLIGVFKKSQIKSAKLDLHQTNCKEMQKFYFSSLHIFY